MFLSMNAASATKKHAIPASETAARTVAPEPSTRAVAAEPTSGGTAAFPVMSSYTSASLVNPFSTKQTPATTSPNSPASPLTGNLGESRPLSSFAFRPMPMPKTTAATPQDPAQIEAKLLGYPPVLVANNRVLLDIVANDFTKAEKMAFAKALLNDTNVPADKKYDVLRQLTEAGQPGDKNALTMNDFLEKASWDDMYELGQVMKNDPVAKKRMLEDVAKHGTPKAEENMAMACLRMGGPEGRQALRSLLANMSRDGLERILDNFGGRPEMKKALAEVLVNHPEVRGRLNGLSQSKLEQVTTILVEHSPNASGRLFGEALTDLLGAMKPKARNVFFDKLQGMPEYDAKVLAAARRDDDFLKNLGGLLNKQERAQLEWDTQHR